MNKVPSVRIFRKHPGTIPGHLTRNQAAALGTAPLIDVILELCGLRAFLFHSSEDLRFQTFCHSLIPWLWPSLPLLPWPSWLPWLPSSLVLPLQVAAFRSYIDAMLRRAGAAHPPYQSLRKP